LTAECQRLHLMLRDAAITTHDTTIKLRQLDLTNELLQKELDRLEQENVELATQLYDKELLLAEQRLTSEKTGSSATNFKNVEESHHRTTSDLKSSASEHMPTVLDRNHGYNSQSGDNEAICIQDETTSQNAPRRETALPILRMDDECSQLEAPENAGSDLKKIVYEVSDVIEFGRNERDGESPKHVKECECIPLRNTLQRLSVENNELKLALRTSELGAAEQLKKYALLEVELEALRQSIRPGEDEMRNEDASALELTYSSVDAHGSSRNDVDRGNSTVVDIHTMDIATQCDSDVCQCSEKTAKLSLGQLRRDTPGEMNVCLEAHQDDCLEAGCGSASLHEARSDYKVQQSNSCQKMLREMSTQITTEGASSFNSQYLDSYNELRHNIADYENSGPDCLVINKCTMTSFDDGLGDEENFRLVKYLRRSVNGEDDFGEQRILVEPHCESIANDVSVLVGRLLKALPSDFVLCSDNSLSTVLQQLNDIINQRLYHVDETRDQHLTVKLQQAAFESVKSPTDGESCGGAERQAASSNSGSMTTRLSNWLQLAESIDFPVNEVSERSRERDDVDESSINRAHETDVRDESMLSSKMIGGVKTVIVEDFDTGRWDTVYNEDPRVQVWTQYGSSCNTSTIVISIEKKVSDNADDSISPRYIAEDITSQWRPQITSLSAPERQDDSDNDREMKLFVNELLEDLSSSRIIDHSTYLGDTVRTRLK